MTAVNPTHLISQVLKKDFYGSVVNWTEYQIFVESKEEIPKILNEGDENSEEFGFYNLRDARNHSYKEARISNRSKLNRALENIILDENYTVGEWMDQDSKLKSKILNYYNGEFEIENKKIQQKYLLLKSMLNLRGKKNLLSLLYSDLGGEEIPTFTDSLPTSEFTGFIFDLRELSIQPSLFPKIQNEYGTDIFNKYMAHPASVQELGMVGYYSDANDPRLVQRVGKNPYKIFPIQVVGKNKTNLIIPYEEAKKILSSERNRKNIKLCKIAFLIQK
jgi:hypothetical protein